MISVNLVKFGPHWLSSGVFFWGGGAPVYNHTYSKKVIYSGKGLLGFIKIFFFIYKIVN